MTQYTKPTDLPAWAESGDKVQPTNAEIQTGWPNSPVPPSRQRFNWLLNWLSQGVRYFMQRGIAEWDATEDYPQYGVTQFNGLTYRSINGTGNINKQPDTEPTFWERWGYSFSQIQPRVDMLVSVAVTTADVTLTAAQAEAGILNITGVLTGNRNVIIPNASRRLVVVNNTTGAFTLGIKTASGSSFIIGQSTGQGVYCDGANNVTSFSASIALASQAEAEAGTENTKIMTALRVAQAIAALTPPGVKPGTIIDFAGTSAPTGYLACPTSLTNVSRTTYAALFAAIGTTWGVGDGSTTFGLPWFSADYAAVQASANVGTNSVGQVIAHTHTVNFGTTGGLTSQAGANQTTSQSGNTGSTGGTANLAAGVRVLKCVKY